MSRETWCGLMALGAGGLYGVLAAQISILTCFVFAALTLLSLYKIYQIDDANFCQRFEDQSRRDADRLEWAIRLGAESQSPSKSEPS